MSEIVTELRDHEGIDGTFAIRELREAAANCIERFEASGWRSCIDHIIKPEDPCPVCRIERLNAALDQLARLGNEPDYGNSVGNTIAIGALKTEYEDPDGNPCTLNDLCYAEAGRAATRIKEQEAYIKQRDELIEELELQVVRAVNEGYEAAMEENKHKNCWLFHRWGKWSDPEAGEAICFNRWKHSIEVQERQCLRCNKRELREAGR